MINNDRIDAIYPKISLIWAFFFIISIVKWKQIGYHDKIKINDFQVFFMNNIKIIQKSDEE